MAKFKKLKSFPIILILLLSLTSFLLNPVPKFVQSATVVHFPDSVHSSYLVNDANNITANDGQYANMTGITSWIIVQWNSPPANCTEIQWELAPVSTGQLFRFEGSNDLSVWTTLFQDSFTYLYPGSGNSSMRYDGDIHTVYQYIRISQLKQTSNRWYLDYIAYIVHDTPIVYASGTTHYAYELQEFGNWGIYGSHPASDVYASRPYNLLGASMGNTADDYLQLVNADWDPDNYVIVDFGNYYNVTQVGVRVRTTGSGDHFYHYISQNTSVWELAQELTGQHTPLGWESVAMNRTYIRYMKFNGTALASNVQYIEASRLIGELSGGSPPAGNGDGAGDLVDFSELPQLVADLFNIELIGGQLFLSTIILTMFLLPLALWSRKNTLPTIIVGFTLMGFLIVVDWLPYWIMLMVILIVAGIYASKMANVIH